MVCVSAITRAELLYGLKRLPADHRLHLAVRQFLKIVRMLPWDAEAAHWYADIRHQIMSSDPLIGELDMIIAAYSLMVVILFALCRHSRVSGDPGRLQAFWIPAYAGRH